MALESEGNIEFAKWLKQWRMVIHNRTPMRSQPEKREIDSTPLRGQPVGCEAGNKTSERDHRKKLIAPRQRQRASKKLIFHWGATQSRGCCLLLEDGLPHVSSRTLESLPP